MWTTRGKHLSFRAWSFINLERCAWSLSLCQETTICFKFPSEDARIGANFLHSALVGDIFKAHTELSGSQLGRRARAGRANNWHELQLHIACSQQAKQLPKCLVDNKMLVMAKKQRNRRLQAGSQPPAEVSEPTGEGRSLSTMARICILVTTLSSSTPCIGAS